MHLGFFYFFLNKQIGNLANKLGDGKHFYVDKYRNIFEFIYELYNLRVLFT